MDTIQIHPDTEDSPFSALSYSDPATVGFISRPMHSGVAGCTRAAG